MRVAIIGASGSIGTILVRFLLNTTDYQLVLFSHHAEDLAFPDKEERRLTHINGTVLKKDDIQNALKDCDAAVYLVHLMGDKSRKGKFITADAEAATNFAEAAAAHHINNIVYVGGMGKPNQAQTQHLAAREQTGQIFRTYLNNVIEFKVPLVVGPKAAGFETLRSLVERLPVIPIPKWANAEFQPITITDVARYINAALKLQNSGHLTIEIGGPETMTYQTLARRYAKHINKRSLTFVVRPVPKWLAVKAIVLLTPKASSATVADMIESAAIPMVTNTTQARQLFPDVIVEPIEASFRQSY